MASNADRFLAQAQRLHMSADSIVPDGRLAGMTVRDAYAMLKKEEESITGLQTSANSGDMTLQDALDMALQSPDPASYRVPYGPFQGMSVDQLVQRANEQRGYLQQAGVIPQTPKEPTMTDQLLPTILGTGSLVGAGYLTHQLSGQAALNEAQTAESAARTAAVQGGQQGTQQAGQQALGQAGTRAVPPSPAGAPAGPVYGPANNPAAATSGASQLGADAGYSAYGTSLDPVATSGFGSGALGGGTSATPVFGMNPALGPAAVAAAGLGYEAQSLFKDPKKWVHGDEKFNGINGASVIRNKVGGLLGFGAKHDQAFYDRADTRDAFRGDSSIYDGNNIGLAGGGKFDIGSMDDSYNIDFSGEDSGRDNEVSQLDALTYALTGFQGKRRSDQVGELYNAANSSGDAMANIQQIARNSGKSFDELRESIRSATDITESERATWLANIDKVEQYAGPSAAAVLPGNKGATLPTAPSSADRNAGRPAPGVTPIPTGKGATLAAALVPATSNQKKPNNGRLKAFWGT